MEYKDMLKKARSNLPESVVQAERFEVPKIKGHVQGNKTVISNFVQIADFLNRKTEHLLKYILKELAAPGEIQKNNVLIIGTKVPASRINEKIKQYVKELVICTECGKPETKLVKEGNITFVTCQACGARYSIKSKI